MNAIGIPARRVDKLPRLLPDDIRMCYVSAMGLCLLGGLEFHQNPVMGGILLVFEKHDVVFCEAVSIRLAERSGAPRMPWKTRLRPKLVAKLLLIKHDGSRAAARAIEPEQRMACMYKQGRGPDGGAEESPEVALSSRPSRPPVDLQTLKQVACTLHFTSSRDPSTKTHAIMAIDCTETL